jgi:hypothetical protein
MEIKLKKITIGELAEGYKDNNEEGVIAYNGKLDVRPPYQREFVYKPDQRNSVIDSIWKKFPLNIMYWNVKKNGNFEIIDGQQRTISICQFVNGDFSFQRNNISLGFSNYPDNEQKDFKDYELSIYLCEGTESERLDWFQTINIAGAVLRTQEIKNAVFAGVWVTEARKYFSKTGCPAYSIGGKYLSGTAIRQDYLETIIRWISKNKTDDYMGNMQKDPKVQDADDLITYFNDVMEWVKSTIPNYRNNMQGIEWGKLYNNYGNKTFDSAKLQNEIDKLNLDDDVTKKAGIYYYIFDNDQKHLSIRQFTNSQKTKAYTKQKGICPECQEKFDEKDMQADHQIPWSQGGKTIDENCVMLCKDCNRKKGSTNIKPIKL